MAGEKSEPPPQLGPISTYSPPHSPPQQQLSGTRSGGISAGSSKSTERPVFSPKLWPLACPELSNISPCQPHDECINHILTRRGEEPTRPRRGGEHKVPTSPHTHPPLNHRDLASPLPSPRACKTQSSHHGHSTESPVPSPGLPLHGKHVKGLQGGQRKVCS